MATQDYSDLIAKYSKKYGVPEKLVQQLINVESSGNAGAVSPTGPRGLMQVSKAVAEEAGYSRADMFDPEKNIDAGVQYLAKNLKAFNGNVSHALLGYNQGTGGAKEMLSGKKPMAQEGYNYIHNKKFSPEYLAKDSSIPKPSDGTEDTEDLVSFGKLGMQKPTQDSGYSNASLGSVTPTQAPPQEQQPAPPKEKSLAETINDAAGQVRGIFNHAQVYQTQAAQQGVSRGLSDYFSISQTLPSVRNAAALFGGFK